MSTGNLPASGSRLWPHDTTLGNNPNLSIAYLSSPGTLVSY